MIALALGGSTVPLSSLSATVLLSIVPQKPAAASLSSAFCAAASFAALKVSVPLPLSVDASLAPPDSTAPFAPPSHPPQQRCIPFTSTFTTGSLIPASANPAAASTATPTLIIPASDSSARPRPHLGLPFTMLLTMDDSR